MKTIELPHSCRIEAMHMHIYNKPINSRKNYVPFPNQYNYFIEDFVVSFYLLAR